MSFWRGRRVLVTGHTGFKGSWLSLQLADLGAEVTGFSLPPPTEPSLFVAARVAKHVRHIDGDVRDSDAVRAAVASARPEIVLHLAAQSLVRTSYEEPDATFATNVMGTVNVLEGARRSDGLRAIVVVTSDKCYENRETGRAYVEDDPMGGHDPYSASKGCAELVVSAYRRSFFGPADHARHGVALASARAGNVIGGGDWAKDRLVPDLMRDFAAGRRTRIRFPEAVRPWQHVLEPLSGYLELARRLCEGEVSVAECWNFGPAASDAQPVRRLADRLAELWGEGAGWDATGEPQPHEAGHLSLDCTKAEERLGWRPTWNLDEGLAQTLAWYQAYYRGADAYNLTVNQIRAHARASAPSPSLAHGR
ncbi:MAG: CDP-glucose 4,6-dehydratase [Caulobacteraceae bacterium]|nr:CDP-glucose 4,6-dehydratase [Caulobacteraceae bacterium]